MIQVLSVSLGSAARDHTVELALLGRQLRVRRLGCDGDPRRALDLYRQHDGRVDAFGVGGAELDLRVGGRTYPLAYGRRIRRVVRHTPLADGSRIRGLLERRALAALTAAGYAPAGRTALVSAAVDRYDLALALREQGCRLVLGDLMFGLGLPLRLHSLRSLERLAAALLPLLLRLPVSLLYPTGAAQGRAPNPRFESLLADVEILAGDFLQLHQYLPRDLRGRVMVTNTTTAADLELLARRGLDTLVTSTPRLGGRSFGTNVAEAMLLALAAAAGAADPTAPATLAALADAAGLAPALCHPGRGAC